MSKKTKWKAINIKYNHGLKNNKDSPDRSQN